MLSNVLYISNVADSTHDGTDWILTVLVIPSHFSQGKASLLKIKVSLCFNIFLTAEVMRENSRSACSGAPCIFDWICELLLKVLGQIVSNLSRIPFCICKILWIPCTKYTWKTTLNLILRYFIYSCIRKPNVQQMHIHDSVINSFLLI